MNCEWIFNAAWAASLLILAASLVLVQKVRHERPRKKRIISSLHMFMAGVFIATFIIFIPIYYTDYYQVISDSAFIRPFLLSLHNTMRVFILDGDFDTIKNAVKGFETGTQIVFTLYSAVLYVLAPILTAGFILSMFKSVTAELRYRHYKKNPTFIFSELNDKSVALAKSVYDKFYEKGRNKKPVIVFAEVYDKTQEDHYENVAKAKEIGAIFMQKDIVDIDIEKKKGRVELFLIGEDESENVSQAITLIEKYKNRSNTKVFVFARSAGSASIIDSIEKSNHLAKIDLSNFDKSDFVEDSELFKVRRIDDIQLLAWKSVHKADIFNRYTEIDGEKVISVLLLGMGEYGIELFKTLVWYGQMQGYGLEINVVDKCNDGGTARAKLSHQCPEILATNNKKTEGDAFYSIEFFEGVDVFNDSWDNVICYSGDDAEMQRRAERLRRTTIAFVALGDDDKNIQASVELRTMFDRVNSVYASPKQPSDEFPIIYSIVHNEQKAGNLRRNSGKKKAKDFDADNIGELKNYRDQPYNIRFIGSISSQYQYDEIYQEETEKIAFRKCHIAWVYEGISKGEDIDLAEQRRSELKKYEEFEYFRLSSISKAMHKIMIDSNPEFKKRFGCLEENAYDCECVNCWNRRRNEHNRWNAYMRSIGYVYGPNRADRAKVHHNLVPFDKLSRSDQLKD